MTNVKIQELCESQNFVGKCVSHRFRQPKKQINFKTGPTFKCRIALDYTSLIHI